MAGNLSENLAGNLSENIHYSKDPITEKESDYCKIVINALENPNNRDSAFTHSKPSRKEDNNAENEGTSQLKRLEIEPVNLPQMQQCIMEGIDEVGCEGCNIRFYHHYHVTQ